MSKTESRQVVLDILVVGFGGPSPHEHDPFGRAVGVLGRWRCEAKQSDVDVIACAGHQREACHQLAGLQPGDVIEIAGTAYLVEFQPCLHPTVVVDVDRVEVMSRAPQPWQRGATA